MHAKLILALILSLSFFGNFSGNFGGASAFAMNEIPKESTCNHPLPAAMGSSVTTHYLGSFFIRSWLKDLWKALGETDETKVLLNNLYLFQKNQRSQDFFSKQWTVKARYVVNDEDKTINGNYLEVASQETNPFSIILKEEHVATQVNACKGYHVGDPFATASVRGKITKIFSNSQVEIDGKIITFIENVKPMILPLHVGQDVMAKIYSYAWPIYTFGKIKKISADEVYIEPHCTGLGFEFETQECYGVRKFNRHNVFAQVKCFAPLELCEKEEFEARFAVERVERSTRYMATALAIFADGTVISHAISTNSPYSNGEYKLVSPNAILH